MRRPDRLGLVCAVPLIAGLLLPFAGLRPNRIAAPDALHLPDIFGWPAAALVGLVAVAAVLGGRGRAVRAGAALTLWLALMGLGATRLSAEASALARVSPGAGFWLGGLALALLLTDALARWRPTAVMRLGLLAAAVILLGLILTLWGDTSLLKEYANRRTIFWTEARRHMALAGGSFVAAVAVGVPLGILAQRGARLRGPLLGALTAVQTVPSIALFGLLILPLGWVAATLPGAAALGISGIGMAPAFTALFLYALLPMVVNTVAGLDAVPPAVTEAARGMGLTPAGRLARIDLPLALPVILTGARIVLVQNIGLATVGALIGAGGFGSFVFQGLGQTAADLILLGALPTVALAFAAQVVFDALIELMSKGRP
ncbi:ABC transporter permease [Falsirhodobacter algicola]|uniref:ABC transporter permease subunit n=1 Tax=Falsirhodobacter algicola TaxID=2692330 RepID=A0A8J8MTR1_9RHOB|nr:ABC transporter permease [Falsirhodobacter algicola]QUS36246.1 ABC transporter permease subunit [Falsirhodobacter algicola]